LYLPRFSRKPLSLQGRNRRIALDMLDHLLGWFEQEGIDYSLDFGTLLGAIRERDFIEWDDDIDLCVFDHDVPKIMAALPRLNNINYRARTRSWDLDIQGCTLGKVRTVKIHNRELLFFKGRVHTDLYIKYRLDDGWNWQSHGKRCRAPHHFHVSYETIDFLGRSVRVPADTEAYLAHSFGPDWRTPVGSGWKDHSMLDT
jgi:hypothetical protein